MYVYIYAHTCWYIISFVGNVAFNALYGTGYAEQIWAYILYRHTTCWYIFGIGYVALHAFDCGIHKYVCMCMFVCTSCV